MSSFFAGRWFYALLPFPALLGIWLLAHHVEYGGVGQPAAKQVWGVTIASTLILYGALFLVRASARARQGTIFEPRRCQNGHRVPGWAKICERCGAPVPGGESRS